MSDYFPMLESIFASRDTSIGPVWIAVAGLLFLAACVYLAVRVRRSVRLRRSGRTKDSAADLTGQTVGNLSPASLDSGQDSQGRESLASTAGQSAFPELKEEPAEHFWERLKGRLSKTQDHLIGRVDSLLSVKRVLDQETLEELEEILLSADLGIKTSYHLLSEIQQADRRKRLTPTEVKSILKERVRAVLQTERQTIDPAQAKPFVIMVVGVNGVGKTTTIGKLAALLGNHGNRKVMLVAADTFRPAAIEQLAIWSQRVGSEFVKHQIGADPSAVVYDAMHAAISRKCDLVLVDTAGRLHTKSNLIEELRKIQRVMGKELKGAPHEVLLVLDATTGQNALHQARIFHESLGVTGIVLTKLDGTAKGGVVISISNELQLPVRFIGIGEQIGDLREFDAGLFTDALFSDSGRTMLQ